MAGMAKVLRSIFSPQCATLKALFFTSFFLVFASCQSQFSGESTSPEIIVAAAANLTEAAGEIGQRFTNKTGIRVIFSFGATADLAKQIENGAPFDVYVAADVFNVDRLQQQGLLTTESRAVYTRGRLVLWVPAGNNLSVQHIQDITAKEFERIAIAKPDVAPYGQAAVDSLRAVGVWDQIQPKVIYAQNVAQAKQFAATGNAEVAFIPLALVKTAEGAYLEVDHNLHRPIDQALGILKSSTHQTAARQFVDFLLSEEGQQILEARGYRRAQ
jgi:molybdate transport system substrate-binding protein